MQRLYSRSDFRIAALLVCVVFVTAILGIDAGHYWGDDFAAYINEAIAISEGTLDQQNQLNLFMHQGHLSYLTEDAQSLCYVWGFPLLLVPIYRIFGFDRTTYSTLIYYKLPGVLCLALLACVLYFFYRRRFGTCPSAALSLLFTLNESVRASSNSIETELPFVLFLMLSLLLVELLNDASTTPRRWTLALLLGMCLWAAYVIRLNGATVVLACALCSLISAWQKHRHSIRQLFVCFLPYAVFGLLLLLSYQVLPVPTSNLSDVGNTNQSTFAEIFRINRVYLFHWMNGFLSGGSFGFFSSSVIPLTFIALAILGLIRSSSWKNLHLAVLLISTIIGIYSLSYTQELRYFLPVMPLFLLFASHGVQAILLWIHPHLRSSWQPLLTFCVHALLVIAAAFVLFNGLNSGIHHFQHRGDPLSDNDAYSTDAIDMYNYIQNETPAHSVVAFFKPRLLYLNTQRVSYRLQMPLEQYGYTDYGPWHDLERDLQYADYFLVYRDVDKSYFHTLEQAFGNQADALELVHQNSQYDLYYHNKDA